MADYRRNLSKSVCEGLLGNKSLAHVPSIRDTVVIRYGDELHVKYHQTSVVIFLPNGDIRLSSGGWHTTTTKSRINAAINAYGWYLYQEKGEWYIQNKNSDARYTFTDGMEVSE